MLVFAEGRKPDNPAKNSRSKATTDNKLDSHMTPGQNRTRAKLEDEALSPVLPNCSYLSSLIMKRKSVLLTDLELGLKGQNHFLKEIKLIQ